MPDRHIHQQVATAVGLGVGLYSAQGCEGAAALARIVGAVLGAKLGGALPDVLEPATSSWHRGTFHSIAALTGSAAIALSPPMAVQAWRRELDAEVRRLRTERESMPVGHSDRAVLQIRELLIHILIGATIGIAAGYVSHLVLDAGTPRGLPIF